MKTILVVDDEENIRLLYKMELSEEGYRVITASSGEEALEILEKEKPDLITLDIKMGGMSGIEFLRKIKNTNRDLPVIISTAYGDYKDDFSVWASDAYITKSATLDELKARIKELLS